MGFSIFFAIFMFAILPIVILVLIFFRLRDAKKGDKTFLLDLLIFISILPYFILNLFERYTINEILYFVGFILILFLAVLVNKKLKNKR